jgi:hypothetical protein
MAYYDLDIPGSALEQAFKKLVFAVESGFPPSLVLTWLVWILLPLFNDVMQFSCLLFFAATRCKGSCVLWIDLFPKIQSTTNHFASATC